MKISFVGNEKGITLLETQSLEENYAVNLPKIFKNYIEHSTPLGTKLDIFVMPWICASSLSCGIFISFYSSNFYHIIRLKLLRIHLRL